MLCLVEREFNVQELLLFGYITKSLGSRGTSGGIHSGTWCKTGSRRCRMCSVGTRMGLPHGARSGLRVTLNPVEQQDLREFMLLEHALCSCMTMNKLSDPSVRFPYL